MVKTPVSSDFILTNATERDVRLDGTRMMFLAISEDFAGKSDVLIEDLSNPVDICLRNTPE